MSQTGQNTWIDINAKVMGGKPCIRNTRVTVDTIVGLIELNYTIGDLLEAYPYLTENDLRIALTYSRDAERTSMGPTGKE